MLYVLLAIYAAAVAGGAALLMRLRPNWNRLPLVAASSIPGPLLLLVLLAIGFGGAFLYEPAPDDSAGIDARYHAMGAYLFFMLIGVPILLAIGALTSWLVSGMSKR